MPQPRTGSRHLPDDLIIDADPFASVSRAADLEADDIIIGDHARRTGRDLRAQDVEIPSGLIR